METILSKIKELNQFNIVELDFVNCITDLIQFIKQFDLKVDVDCQTKYIDIMISTNHNTYLEVIIHFNSSINITKYNKFNDMLLIEFDFETLDINDVYVQIKELANEEPL